MAASSTAWGADNGKLKIFILAGQSNMQGWGKVEHGGNPNTSTRDPNVLAGLGSLRAMVIKDPHAYSSLLDTSKSVTYSEPGNSSIKKTFPAWATRSDVWVTYWDLPKDANEWANPPPPANITTIRRNGPLSVGFGGREQLPEGFVGPELGFGHVVGNAIGDKVLLIKTAWGGKSLAVDYRPPSSGQTGSFYSEMIKRVKLVLSDVKAYYPAYDGKGYELLGFGWHQGFSDRVNSQYVAQYESNLANLIRDVRKDLGAPKLLFVIANTGMAEANENANAVNLIAAQDRVSNASLHPEFAGTVKTVDTRPFDYGNNSPAPNFGYHWNLSGESYFRVGERMGNAMVQLLKNNASGPPGYATKCADEYSACKLTGTRDVAYGANGKFKFKYGVEGTVGCNNSNFGGDPIVGVGKACYSRKSSPPGYSDSMCGKEHDTCNLKGTNDVAFGANGQFKYKRGKSGPVVCTNKNFGGDPIPGVVKACYVMQTSSQNGPYQHNTKCADERGTCTLVGTHDVSYGANGKFKFKYGQSGTVACNNTSFGGDPVPGVFKACYYK